MKKYTLSLLMMISLSAFAMPNEEKKSEKAPRAVVTATAEINPMLAVKQLQEENSQLKQQLFTLMNENEELKSQLSFEVLMNNMFSNLSAKRQNDVVEDLNATLNYNKLMAAMLQQLKARK